MESAISFAAMLISVAMMGAFLFYAIWYKQELAVRYFIGVMVCRIVYAIGVILELNSLSIEGKLFFRSVEQTALLFTVPFMIQIVQELFGWDKLLKPLRQFLLFFVFGLWSLLIWSDSKFHFIYRTTEMINGHLVTTRTVYAITFNIICFMILAACVFFLVQYIRNVRADILIPGLWVLLLGSLPLLLEIVKLTSPEWSSWLLPISAFSGFTGIAMLGIIFRYRLFSIIPIARNVVVDTLQQGILIVNQKGRVVDGNSSIGQWFTQQEHFRILGRDISELLVAWPAWRKLCEQMEPGSVEIDILLGGERKFYSVNVYPVYTQRKRGQGSVSVLFDITEKQRRMEQIAQLNRLKDQLFTIVSHDIRGPMALQMQLIELLEEDRDGLDAERNETIEALGGQIRNTFGMVENLLEWFRSQREGMVLRPQLLELSKVVKESCRMLQIKNEVKGISVRSEIAGGIYVYADREAISLIIRNLLSNSIKFTGRGGWVNISAQYSSGMVIVTVRDNGVGMEEEQVRNLFDETRFISSTGTAGEKGAGLGLLVCQQFVQLSGGRLWAESAPAQGSVFHFTLKDGEGL
jgi:signal transduction histidine kinase